MAKKKEEPKVPKKKKEEPIVDEEKLPVIQLDDCEVFDPSAIKTADTSSDDDWEDVEKPDDFID